jgi:hypothetical protein
MECIKKYKEIILIGLMVLGFGWWLRTIDATAGEAKKMAEQNAQINAKLSAIVVESNTKLQVYLEIMGFDDEAAREWAEMPRKCPTDTLGHPIIWEPWLEVKEGLDVGIRYMVNDSLDVLIDTLWDFREAEP